MFIWERLITSRNGELYCIFIENGKKPKQKQKMILYLK